MSTPRRTRVEGEVTTWVRAHRGALQVAGAVVAGLVLLVADLTWVGLLVILLLLLVFELVVLRLGAGGDGDDRARRRRLTSRSRTLHDIDRAPSQEAL